MPTLFIVGKKGGGKTLRAMRAMEKELRSTDRSVVTNFPIDYERFREYLLNKYGKDFGYKKRLVMLNTEQTAHFWLYYGLDWAEYIPFEARPVIEQERERKRVARENASGNDKAVPEGKWFTHPKKITKRKFQFEANDEKKTRQEVPDFSEREGSPSVAYFLDELHLTFNSRRWTRTGEDCLYYISLERHFGDDQVFCTQCFDNVDKQMRSMGQEYVVCTNQRKMALPGTFGLVRRPGAFTAAHYTEPPTGRDQQATTVYTFALDAEGIASCYRTVAGAEFGVGDDLADKKVAQRGKIPFSVMLLIALVLAIGGYFGVSYGAQKFVFKAAGGAGGTVKEARAIPKQTNAVEVISDAPPASKRKAPAADRVDDQVKPPEVFLAGVFTFKGLRQVVLSDGRNYVEGQPDFPRLVKDGFGQVRGVKMGSEVLRFKPQDYYGQADDRKRR